jgi:hypothetical protein
MVALGLLFGLMGGAVIATAAVTRRTDSAYTRLVAATHRHDATVIVAGDRADVAGKVTALPGVRASWSPGAWIGRIHGTPSLAYLSLVAGSAHPDVFQPVLLRGRLPHDDAVDEILVSEPMTRDFVPAVDVGSVLDITLLTTEQASQFDTGIGEPAGPATRLRVVGVGRMPLWTDGFHAVGSPAFAARYRPVVAGYIGLIRLQEGEPARRAFAEGLDELAAAYPTPPEYAEFGPLKARYPPADEESLISPVRRVVVAALTVSTWLAGLAALLFIAQALARHHAVGVENQRIEAALGLVRAERVVARTLPAVPGALLAGTVGAVIAAAAGYLRPLGALKDFEPAPGYLPDPAAVAVGAAGLGVLFLLIAALTAAIVVRDPVPVDGTPARGARVPAGWLPPSLRAGWSLVQSHSGRSGAATVAARVGITAAVTALVAAVTFGASLDRLVTTPARYGWNVDVSIADAQDDEIAQLVNDDRVATLDIVTGGQTRLGDTPVGIYAFDHRKGANGPALVAGRLPRTPDEIAVGPRLATRHELSLGDEVILTRADGGTTRMRVVGIAMVRLIGNAQRLGDQVITHPKALLQLVGQPETRDADIRAVPGRAADLTTDLRHLEIAEPEPPQEVTTLADIRLLPYVVAAIAGSAAVAGLLHAMLTAGRRNRREFAILQAIGFTRGQIRLTRTTTATTLLLPALIIGIPVGFAAGRIIWYEVAVASGAAGDAPVPAAWLIGITAAALLTTAATAAVTGKPGSPESVGSTLRVE